MSLLLRLMYELGEGKPVLNAMVTGLQCYTHQSY